MTAYADYAQATTIYNAAAGTGSGAAFALPPHAVMITWQVIYGTPPGSITINLQASNDGTNFQTIDNTSAVTNNTVRITACSAKFIRINVSAIVGGDTITVIASLGSLGNGVQLFGQGPAILDTQEATVGLSGGGVAEEVLYQLTIPARTFVVSGRTLRVRAFGHTGANANTKTVRIKFGADSWVVFSGGVNNVDWTAEMLIMRRSFGIFIRRGSGLVQGVLPVTSVFAASIDETVAQLVQVTGQTSVATANDVTVEGVIVDSLPGLPGITG